MAPGARSLPFPVGSSASVSVHSRRSLRVATRCGPVRFAHINELDRTARQRYALGSQLAHDLIPVYVGPFDNELLTSSLARAGARLASPHEAEVVVWLDSRDRHSVRSLVHDRTAWVQLPSAGVDAWTDVVEAESGSGVVFCSARGAYSQPVAEHALALLLACGHEIVRHSRAVTWEPRASSATRAGLVGADVLIVGCGGVGTALLRLLQSLNTRTIAVTRSGRHVRGASRSVSSAELDAMWSEADYIVLSAPLTSETRHVINAHSLARMRREACLVNVGRGGLVSTPDLIAALDRGDISGAALDVTDPEPLPDGHPLWTHPRVLITPHIANPGGTHWAYLAERLVENLLRYRSGRPLLGAIDTSRGY